MKSSPSTAYSLNPLHVTSNFKNTESDMDIIIDLAELYNKNADEPDFDCEFLSDPLQD